MITLRDIARRLDEEDLKYEFTDGNGIHLGMTGEYRNHSDIFFHTDGDEVTINILPDITFRNPNMRIMMEINELNHKYKSYSFYLDEDNDLVMKANAIVSENTSTDEVWALFFRGVRIVDNFYPTVQKLLWS